VTVSINLRYVSTYFGIDIATLQEKFGTAKTLSLPSTLQKHTSSAAPTQAHPPAH
jgi:hypothetical protein